MPGSVLEPHGPKTAEIAALWWTLLVIASVVLAVVLAFLVLGLLAQRRAPPLDAQGLVRPSRLASMGSNALVVVFGVAVPTVVLLGTLVLDVRTLAAIAQPPAQPSVILTVTGHQFWWEFQYPSAGVVTAGELHIPVGEPVELHITSSDVIHSFWVPQLLGKLDANPYQSNTTWMQASSPGVYRGECAEFCGVQHAHMGFVVVADARPDFDAWLQHQQDPAAVPIDSDMAAGAQAFARAGCIQCHAIRYGSGGVGGSIGPDLTHVGSRRTIAGNTLDNTLGTMEGWIGNPQAIKPGNNMPALPLDSATLRALAVYLVSLK